MFEGQDEEMRNKIERKDPKYKKYGKKGKKCSNKKCKKTIKYNNKTRSIELTSHFDQHIVKELQDQNFLRDFY